MSSTIAVTVTHSSVGKDPERMKAATVVTSGDSASSDERAGSDVSDTTECRICYGEEGGTLHCYCDCRGSAGLVHEHCLLHWLSVSGRNQCELCSATLTLSLGCLRCCWKWRVPSSTEGFIFRWAIFVIGLVATCFNLSTFAGFVRSLWNDGLQQNGVARCVEMSAYFLVMVIPSLAITVYSAVALQPILKAFCLSNRRITITHRDSPVIVPASLPV